MALREDTNSTDVRILIKGDELAMDASLDASEDGKHVQGRDGSMVEKTVEVGSPVTRAAIGDTISAGLQDDAIKSSARQNSETRHQGVSLEAHKAVLDGNPYFYRMLNSGFKESQPTMEQADDKEPAASSKRSTFNIVLSSNLFPIAIMDFLLDYLYCRRPFPDYVEKASHVIQIEQRCE
ncbi:hypothetical protein CPC16_003186 [Podila verticillata]|nr:hypothetical protein CPC16_003186 [Podila verticillata]